MSIIEEMESDDLGSDNVRSWENFCRVINDWNIYEGVKMIKLFELDYDVWNVVFVFVVYCFVGKLFCCGSWVFDFFY